VSVCEGVWGQMGADGGRDKRRSIFHSVLSCEAFQGQRLHLRLKALNFDFGT